MDWTQPANASLCVHVYCVIKIHCLLIISEIRFTGRMNSLESIASHKNQRFRIRFFMCQVPQVLA